MSDTYDRSIKVSAKKIKKLMKSDKTLRTRTFLITRKQINSEASIRWKACGGIALGTERDPKASNKKLMKMVEEYLRGERKLKPPAPMAAFMEPYDPLPKIKEGLKKYVKHTEKNNRDYLEKHEEYAGEYFRDATEWAAASDKVQLSDKVIVDKEGQTHIILNFDEELCRVFIENR